MDAASCTRWSGPGKTWVRLRGGLAGRVAVGLPTSVARVLTVPLTRAFREALPEARLSISEGLSGSLQEGLIGGRLDIVVLYNAQPSRELDVTPLMEEDLLLVRARPPGLHEDPPPGPIPAAGRRGPAPGDPDPAERHPHARGGLRWPTSAAGPTWCWRSTA
jgi:DNA-binding transcriptional LysR family regulator